MPRVKGATTGRRKATKKKPAEKIVTQERGRGRRRKKVSETETVKKQKTLEETDSDSEKGRRKSDVSWSQPATSSALAETKDSRISRKRRDSKTDELPENEETKQSSKRRRRRDVKVTDSAMTKWKPVSQSARDLLNSAMLAALGQCMEEVRGRRRECAEIAIQQIMHKVTSEVACARAPSSKNVKYGAELKAKVAEMKEKCVTLVSGNKELDKTMEERKLFCEEQMKQDKLQEVQLKPTPSDNPPPPLTLSEITEQEFTDQMQTLLSHTPLTANLTSSITTTILH